MQLLLGFVIYCLKKQMDLENADPPPFYFLVIVTMFCVKVLPIDELLCIFKRIVCTLCYFAVSVLLTQQNDALNTVLSRISTCE